LVHSPERFGTQGHLKAKSVPMNLYRYEMLFLVLCPSQFHLVGNSQLEQEEVHIRQTIRSS
jgi:hypothetical protein